MKLLLSLLLLTTAACQSAPKPEDAPAGLLERAGLVQVESDYSFDETLVRLEDAVSRRPLRLFTKIDHAAGASSANLELPPTTLFIFGNPKGGTPLMQAEPTLALQLPLRMLVTERAGKVSVSYPDMEAVARAHGVNVALPTIPKMISVLGSIASEATRR